MEAWRCIHPSVLSKGEQRGRRCLFIIGSGPGKFLVWRRILPEFPQTFTKSFLCNFYLQILSHEDLFWCDLLRVIFCKPWAPFFEVKQGWAPFSRGFSGMFPRFSANQNVWGCAWPPPPTSTTVFHNTIIFRNLSRSTWNIVIAAFRVPRKFRMIFCNFGYYFWSQHCWWTETNNLGNNFFIFHKFPFP